MALNAGIRKKSKKRKGAMLLDKMEEDTKYEVYVQNELLEYFMDDLQAEYFFNSLAKSHLDYFIRWIKIAKTESAKIRCLLQSIEALSNKRGYVEMIRMNRRRCLYNVRDKLIKLILHSNKILFHKIAFYKPLPVGI